MERKSVFCKEVTDFACQVVFRFELGAALFLDEAELFEGGLQDAGESLFVETEELEAEELAV